MLRFNNILVLALGAALISAPALAANAQNHFHTPNHFHQRPTPPPPPVVIGILHAFVCDSSDTASFATINKFLSATVVTDSSSAARGIDIAGLAGISYQTFSIDVRSNSGVGIQSALQFDMQGSDAPNHVYDVLTNLFNPNITQTPLGNGFTRITIPLDAINCQATGGVFNVEGIRILQGQGSSSITYQNALINGNKAPTVSTTVSPCLPPFDPGTTCP